jgi:hypothetical protein
MPWPWWAYCIVPGTGCLWALLDMWFTRRRDRERS